MSRCESLRLYSLIAKKNSPPEKHVESQFGCSPTLVLSPTTKIELGNSNEMCLQGLNLSSNQNSAFHHDLALLQQAMNAAGVCPPQKWKHEHSRMIDFATFCCRWLGNHSFHWCQLKGSCGQAFSVSLLLQFLPPSKIDFHLGFCS